MNTENYKDPLSPDDLSQDEENRILIERFQKGDHFIASLMYLFRGFIVIFEGGLWKVFVFHFLFIWFLRRVVMQINIILFCVIYAVGFVSNVPALSYAWCGVFVLGIMILIVLLTLYGYQLNDCLRRLSEKVEKIMKNGDPDPLFECWHCSETCCHYFVITFLIGFLEVTVFLFLNILLIIVIFIPVVNVLCTFLLTSLELGYVTFKVVFIRRGNYFSVFPYIFENYQAFIGFGVGLALLSHVPIFGTLDVFVGVAGFTMYYLHLEAFKKKDKVDDTSNLLPPSFDDEEDDLMDEDEDVESYQDNDNEQQPQEDNLKQEQILDSGYGYSNQEV